MKKALLFKILLLSLCHSALCSEGSVLSKKVEANIIMLKVVMCSRNTKSLENLGKNTMLHSKEFLKLGRCGLKILSEYKSHSDWKVRFWVADMLGYIKEEESKNILHFIINSKSEKQEVVKQAKQSLKRIQ